MSELIGVVPRGAPKDRNVCMSIEEVQGLLDAVAKTALAQGKEGATDIKVEVEVHEGEVGVGHVRILTTND